MRDVKSVAEIRRINLERLIEERGTLEAVATAAGTSSVYLSQIRNKAIDHKTGRSREMGSAMARRLEDGCGKPTGWMDAQEQPEQGEQAWVAAYREMAPAQRRLMLEEVRQRIAQAREFVMPHQLAELRRELDALPDDERDAAYIRAMNAIAGSPMPARQQSAAPAAGSPARDGTPTRARVPHRR